MYESGTGPAEVARAVGCSEATIHKIKRVDGWVKPPAKVFVLKVVKNPVPPHLKVKAKPKPQVVEGMQKWYGYAFQPRLTDGVPMLEASSRQCRWPLGTIADQTTHLCGETVVKGSYCAHHHKIAYRRP